MMLEYNPPKLRYPQKRLWLKSGNALSRSLCLAEALSCSYTRKKSLDAGSTNFTYIHVVQKDDQILTSFTKWGDQVYFVKHCCKVTFSKPT